MFYKLHLLKFFKIKKYFFFKIKIIFYVKHFLKNITLNR